MEQNQTVRQFPIIIDDNGFAETDKFCTDERQLALTDKFRTLPMYARIASLILLALTLLIVLVELVSHISPMPTVFAPPSDLLPGKRGFPTTAYCESLHDGRFYCHENRNGSEIQLTYDARSSEIVDTVVPMHDKTLGDLILVWGTPTGYSLSGQAIDVYWSMRGAQLTPYSFQPNSLVSYVSYGDIPQQLLPWRGFVSQSFTSPEG